MDKETIFDRLQDLGWRTPQAGKLKTTDTVCYEISRIECNGDENWVSIDDRNKWIVFGAGSEGGWTEKSYFETQISLEEMQLFVALLED